MDEWFLIEHQVHTGTLAMAANTTVVVQGRRLAAKYVSDRAPSEEIGLIAKSVVGAFLDGRDDMFTVAFRSSDGYLGVVRATKLSGPPQYDQTTNRTL